MIDLSTDYTPLTRAEILELLLLHHRTPVIVIERHGATQAETFRTVNHLLKLRCLRKSPCGKGFDVLPNGCLRYADLCGNAIAYGIIIVPSDNVIEVAPGYRMPDPGPAT